MKVAPIVTSLIAAAYAAPAPAEAIGEMVDWAADAVAAPNPLNAAPNGEKVLPRFSEKAVSGNAKRQTVKYGSYMVSSSKMMSTTKPAKGPSCVPGCYVTAMEATIRYPGGAVANVDTGSWLHHIALFGSGAGGGSIWAAGNERPTLRLDDGGNKYGLDFPAMFMLMIDLMVEDTKAKNLTLEIAYETQLKTSGYKAAKMYWLTIGEPAAKQGVYSFTTRPMTSGTGGTLLYAIGHMHDGGTDMTLYVNNKVTCKSVMHYGGREGYGPKGGDMSAMQGGTTGAKSSAKASSGSGHSHKKRQAHAHGGGGADHISDPGACTNFGQVSKGASMYAKANYDATKHKLMTENGKPGRLMGNMRVYVGP